MNQQLRSAELYWNQLLKTRNYSHSPTSDICTVLISSPRGTHPLLHYTLSSLVTAMTPADKSTMEILVYNTARPFGNISLYSIIILLTFWLIWFGFVLLILISTNRQNFQFLVGLRAGVHPIESSVPGTLAQLYPRWIIPILEQFLRKRLQQGLLLNMPIPIDLLLIEFLEQKYTNFQQCHLVPDLVDHIGVYSSSINKNQGSFLSMKQSGTFRWNEAAIDFNLI
ncbi:unnamed protein product [Rotaria sordida]|uniref:Uncharacterized protein n=1 Tax=Rotaria sordida TaxID=392033 RepID=A0A819KVM2_9BILA|nr:unnamed protein product [Rotaria sordida]CAF1255950.1 unnamed protein product [Rotaria sordida]CAF3952869.1 unnamed protein product [Rotaria sordida]